MAQIPFNVIKTVIAVYPGRFQPFGKHHKEAFEWLRSKFGIVDTYIATSDVVKPPKSPLNFKEKREVIVGYKKGYENKLVQVKNPYKVEEITTNYDPKTTAIVFMVGDKDMKENPRFAMKTKKDGNEGEAKSEGYFKPYEENIDNLKSYTQHGYLVVAPHQSFDIPGIGEMSGTNIRLALSSPTTDEQYKKNFIGIFGWYDEKIAKMLKEKFKDNTLKESKILFNLVKMLLQEGGAGGHMAHPFDIDSVNTGLDLAKVFVKTVMFLKKNDAPVKIDGVNASIRLADIDGKKKFVMDRGSNKPLDVKGVTKADLKDRFFVGHGMVKVGGTVLDIFNKSFRKIKNELAQLGMLDNPNILFNIEYVEGTTNVQDYGKNFLAIHGLLEIKQAKLTKRVTSEISYSKEVLEELIKNLQPVANKYGFEVLSTIPAKMVKQPNFQSELSKSYTINIDGKDKQTKSLQDWLKEVKTIPKSDKIKLAGGKVVGALSKQVFMGIKSGKTLSEFIADQKDYKKAIDGFVTYMATMQLGDALLKSLDSRLGPVDQQEGVVIRDTSISPEPFKITGSFIVRGLESSF